MRKYYSEPEMEIKKYALAQKSYITTSDIENPDSNDNDNDLHKDDKIDYFG